MLLIDKINEKLNQLNFNLELESAVYKTKERTLSFVFCYSDDLMLSSKVKEIVNEIIKEEIGEKVVVNIKYKKNYFDETILQNYILECLRVEYPMVGIEQEKIVFEKTDGQNLVKLFIDNSYKDFVENQPICEFLIDKLIEAYKSKFVVEIEFADNVAPKVK